LRLFDGVERLQVKVRWSAGPPLEPIRAGDALGGIRVRNVAYGRASAVPEFDDEIDHPAFQEEALEGDRTPLGETIFWLPPGYWTLVVQPENEEENLEGFTQLECHLVPVQPGRITVVDWPPSLARAFGGEETGRVEILDASGDSRIGTVDVALLNADRLGIEATRDNVRIHEAGVEARILSVERLKTPLDVLLLLDSSGSMKHQMSQALESAAHFIRGLPPDARITTVDFDTRPKKIQAADRAALLKALRRVRADGATALYDSILLGLKELQGKNRPALVVFTDGVDANYNDTGPGSRATKDEVLQAVSRSGIPVYTIGLGDKSDVDTLKRLATLSGGAYYAASTPEDLDPIFERIQKNLGNDYRVRFQRPARPRVGSQPVVSLVVDNSGSMDLDPEQAGCDYRIERVRQTLRRFVQDLPANFMVQLLTFSDEVKVSQVLTRYRPPLARALSLMKGEGGTNTIGAVRAALDSLRAVPSSQRFLVFLTDAALEVEEDDVKEFQTLLGVIRDARIRSLWLGMVEGDQEEVFARAARLSGGRHVIATDLDQVARTFRDLAREMGAQQDSLSLTSLRVEIRHHTPAGENVTLVASRDVDFPPAPEADVETNPEAVTWKAGPPLRPYDPELAADITGSDRVGREALVIKRIPLDYTANNKAVRMHFKEAAFLSRLRGIDAPDGYRFLALTLDLENILPAQKVAILPDGSHHPAAWVGGEVQPVRYENRVPDYLIPDLKRHCFLRWNNERSYPVSEITWLLENPLMVPGRTALAVEPGHPVRGALGFLVPAGAARAASFQYYDTAYGHVTVPLWGVTRKSEPVPMETLPQEAPTRLSETFSFRVTGISDKDRIDRVEAGEGGVFRIIQGEWISRIQAHVRLEPMERIRLLVQDEKGIRLFRLHPVTSRLPLGY
ncbi:von Willebrand factor type A domain-containing protein, partial [Desulfacinum hydrothermale DSM 13146]